MTESLWDRLVEKKVNEVLASMGGDLLSTYGGKVVAWSNQQPDAQTIMALAEAKAMSSLGGYLLERFGEEAADPKVGLDD